MPNYTFKQGDIIHMDFSPQSGREMKGEHDGLIISNDRFNKSEMALVAPITQGTYHRDGGFTTTLMGTGTSTQGVVVANACKILDLRARNAKFKEKCPLDIVDEVHAKFEAIL